MYCKRLAACVCLFLSFGAGAAYAQTTRPRRVADTKTPANAPPTNETPASPEPGNAPPKRRPNPRQQPPVLRERPREKALWADIDLGAPLPSRPAATTAKAAPTNNAPLVKKTALVKPVAPRAFNNRLQNAIEERLGVPYVYGATGNGGYDCSGLVWSASPSSNHSRMVGENGWV